MLRTIRARSFCTLLGLCVVPAATYGDEPAPDRGWYVIAGDACQPQDPRSMLAMGKLLGVSMSTRDVQEHGKVVATTIAAPDGSTATFYRGKARCEAARAGANKELDRYQ